jgi:hypothetical protein
MPNKYSADASALGYLFQIRAALLLLIKFGKEHPDLAVSIEKIDDIAFEKNGSPIELIQTKHHVKAIASLSDVSTDLWKTIRIWASFIGENKYDPTELKLTLITTAQASDNSAASKLRLENRDAETALLMLTSIANSSISETNSAAYKEFLKLEEHERRKLIDCIVIFDRSPQICDTRNLILQELMYVTRPEFLESIYERLEGWWINKAITHLSDVAHTCILHKELQEQINDLQEQFTQDNLPIDFWEEIILEEQKLNKDQRIFIEQLRLVAVSEPRIQKAISDYYRAFQQRSKWVREELLLGDELESYEKRLIDEWQRQHYKIKEKLGVSPSEKGMVESGREVFNWMDSANINIRDKCTEPFVMRGSYHMLSNQLKVGWHLEFYKRLCALLLKPEESNV